MTKRRIDTKTITVLAVSLALMFALTPIPFVSLFLVPVLFVACTHKWYLGAVVGLMFGLVSTMYAFVMPTTVVAIAFTQAPWIAIVPRVFVGITTSFSFWGFRKLFKGKSLASRAAAYNIAASIGTITNTVLVVGSLFLTAHINPNFAGGYIVAPFLITIAIFFSIEMVVANLIVPTLCLTAAKALKIGEFKPRQLERSCYVEEVGKKNETILDVAEVQATEEELLENNNE